MPTVDQFLFGDFDDEFKVAFFDYWYQATLLEETLRTALTRLGRTPRPKATFGQMIASLFAYVATLDPAPDRWDRLKPNLEKFRDERNLLGHSRPSLGMGQIGEQTYEDAGGACRPPEPTEPAGLDAGRSLSRPSACGLVIGPSPVAAEHARRSRDGI
jgi:hypothetical protein